MSGKKNDFNFEEKLRELEQLVTRMEDGNLGLEESLEAFENGVKLVKECQQALEAAEQKVKALTSAEGDTEDLELDPAAD
ncbi:MAG: exodeoxyribonuclease VII small subunit [Gammaproteobacteria bacterium]|nr:exodeoxyribonuclease VII small subunit [Gammaproteobacteria bacterium]